MLDAGPCWQRRRRGRSAGKVCFSKHTSVAFASHCQFPEEGSRSRSRDARTDLCEVRAPALEGQSNARRRIETQTGRKTDSGVTCGCRGPAGVSITGLEGATASGLWDGGGGGGGTSSKRDDGEIANRRASIHEFAAILARLADADAR